jgi:hypothetical protein
VTATTYGVPSYSAPSAPAPTSGAEASHVTHGTAFRKSCTSLCFVCVSQFAESNLTHACLRYMTRSDQFFGSSTPAVEGVEARPPPPGDMTLALAGATAGHASRPANASTLGPYALPTRFPLLLCLSMCKRARCPYVFLGGIGDGKVEVRRRLVVGEFSSLPGSVAPCIPSCQSQPV